MPESRIFPLVRGVWRAEGGETGEGGWGKDEHVLNAFISGHTAISRLFWAAICEGQVPGKERMCNALVQTYTESLSPSNAQRLGLVLAPGSGALAVQLMLQQISPLFLPGQAVGIGQESAQYSRVVFNLLQCSGWHSSEVEDTAGSQHPRSCPASLQINNPAARRRPPACLIIKGKGKPVMSPDFQKDAFHP